MKDKKVQTIVFIFAGVIAIPSWVWLFFYDWKLALAITLLMWGNNIALTNQ